MDSKNRVLSGNRIHSRWFKENDFCEEMIYRSVGKDKAWDGKAFGACPCRKALLLLDLKAQEISSYSTMGAGPLEEKPVSCSMERLSYCQRSGVGVTSSSSRHWNSSWRLPVPQPSGSHLTGSPGDRVCRGPPWA